MAHPGRHAAERPDSAALVIAETGATMTWAELDRSAVQAANQLYRRGLRAGDHVAFCLENRFEFAVMVWACLYAGFRYTPISTRFTTAEVAHVLADSGAQVVVHSTATAAEAASTLPSPIATVDVDVADGADRDEPAEYPRAEGVAMLYSSGTTGRPKGVWRPAPPEPIETLPPGDRAMATAYGFGPEAVYLSPAPLYHAAPLTFLVQMGRLGATTVIMQRFDAEAALAHIGRYGVTHSQWVPTMFVRMLALPDATRRSADLSTHRFAIHGAGPCPIPVKRRMLEWWGPIIHEYYAGTEGAGMCTIGPEEWLAHPGSVGRSVRGPVRILDDEGEQLPVGEIGQVWFENGADFRYLNDDDQTATARRPGGGATFGDVGYLDDDGYLYLTDRRSFTINSGGVNIYPRELEMVLLEHPAVDDVAVFGVPNAEFGEEVKAVVQPRADVVADDALARELIGFCRERVAGYKIPRSVDFDRELPREPTGKLMKGRVRDRYR